MRGLDKRRVIASVVFGALAVQIVAATLAFFMRGSTESSVDAERTRRDELEVRVEMAELIGEPGKANTEGGWQLDEAPDVSGTLQLIQGLGDEAKVELTGLEAKKSSTDGKQTFQITGVALPDELCRFVASIEKHERLIVVETGRILPGAETTVVFDLGLATYYEIEEETGQ